MVVFILRFLVGWLMAVVNVMVKLFAFLGGVIIKIINGFFI